MWQRKNGWNRKPITYNEDNIDSARVRWNCREANGFAKEAGWIRKVLVLKS